MNVLILTPDAVGSTLLQRLLTIYMNLHQFDRPVINLHELTNGLEKYWSPEFNQEIVSKKMVKNWGYYQTLEQVVDLLSSVDHYKTSRLAHYHLVNRKDPIEHLVPFYRYLNENFYIIACQRKNIFEHALSRTFSKITKNLNVYDHQEKVSLYLDYYRNGVELDPRSLVDALNAYRDYYNWSKENFDVSSYFVYEDDIPRIEQYILNLPVFSGHKDKVSWQSSFGIDFNDWNRMHYYLSDIGQFVKPGTLLSQNLGAQQRISLYQQLALPEWPCVNSSQDYDQLPQDVKQKFDVILCESYLPQNIIQPDTERQNFVAKHKSQYQTACNAIAQMTQMNIMISGPPIKKQSLGEKQSIILNFNQCLDVYNQWCEQNYQQGLLDHQQIHSQIQNENCFWNQQPNTVSAQITQDPSVV